MILKMLDDKIHKTEEKTREIHELVEKAEHQEQQELMNKEISFANIGEQQYGSTNIAINRSQQSPGLKLNTKRTSLSFDSYHFTSDEDQSISSTSEISPALQKRMTY